MKTKSLLSLAVIWLTVVCCLFCGCSNTNTTDNPTPDTSSNQTEPPATPDEDTPDEQMEQYLSDIGVLIEYDSATERILVTITNSSPYIFSGEVDIYISNKKDYHKTEIVPMNIKDLNIGNKIVGTINFRLTDEYRVYHKIDSYSFTEANTEIGEEDAEFAERIRAFMDDNFGTTPWGSQLNEYKAFKLENGNYRIEVTLGDVESNIYQAIAVNILHEDDRIEEVVLFDADGNIVFSKTK